MINAEQTNLIRAYLLKEGLTDSNLVDDLVDHISCEIEFQLAQNVSGFEEAFASAKEKILPNEPIEVENDLRFLTTKTQHIMIRKTSYIGGYFSALVFCLAVLFTILSFQNESLVDSRRESMNQQYILSGLDGEEISPEERSAYYQTHYNVTSALKMKAIKQQSTSQTLLIISILLFGLTYLPYRFYMGFQKSELQANSL